MEGYIDNERVYMVREKLEKLQTTMAKQKAGQLGKINERVASLEQKMKATLDSRDNLFSVMNSQVAFCHTSRSTSSSNR